MSKAHSSAGGAGFLTRRRTAAVVLSLSTALVVGVSGCSAANTRTAEPSYGSLPTFLPTATVQADSDLVATLNKPALTTEGDRVVVQLPAARVQVTVTGPDVPGEGLPYQAPSTTCTWHVSMTSASGVVPIRLADFTSLDHLGTVYAMSPVTGEPAVPAQIGPGQTVDFDIQAVMRVGEGLMRWAPGHSSATGSPVVASWDFEVEND